MSHVSPEQPESAGPAPADLDLPPADADVRRYQRAKLTAGVVHLAIGLVGLGVAALALGPWLDGAVGAVVGENRWVRLVVLGLVYAVALEALALPVSFWSGYVVEHRHGLSNQSPGGWVKRQVKQYLLGGVLGLGLLLGLYALIWTAGRWWWVAAAGAWLVVSLVLGQLLPVVILPLFYKVERLEDEGLAERLRRLAEGTGLSLEGVYRLGLSAETKKANAALAGLGRTRRVLLGDTLLKEFTPGEIEVVFAHEVGHHVYGHLAKMIGLGVALTAASFALMDVVLRRAAPALGYASFEDPGALPLVLLVPMVVGLLVGPLQNAVSRHFERQCDRYALARTGDRAAYRSAFMKLARMNKADPDPSRLVVWLFEDHPPIRERLAVAGAAEAAEVAGPRESAGAPLS